MRQEYPNLKAGWYDFDNGKRYYMCCGFEARWGHYLDFLQKAGEIVSWEYEPKKFEFEGIRSGTVFYVPDFKVTYNLESLSTPSVITTINPIWWHETKGRITQKDVTKYRRMAKYYPNEKIILIMQRISQGNSKSARRQRILIEQASKYVERVMEAESQLKKLGI